MIFLELYLGMTVCRGLREGGGHRASQPASKRASHQASRPASEQANKPASQQASKPTGQQQASKPASQQASKPASEHAGQQANNQANEQASNQASEPTDEIIPHTPCIACPMQPAGIHIQHLLVGNRAPLQCIALKEALVLLPSGSVQSVSWQSMALTGRALEGPVTVECWQFGL